MISYCKWVNQFLKKYQGKDGGNPKNINSFLTYLAVESKVSASTQNQALAALLFYFRFVKKEPTLDLGNVVHAKKITETSCCVQQGRSEEDYFQSGR